MSHSLARALLARLILSLAVAAVATAVRPTQADAQRTVRSETNAWLDLASDVWLTPTWGLQGEALIERAERATVPQQMELRLGVQRAVGPSVRLALGGTFIHTSPYGPFPARAPFDERRTWVQATLDQRLTKLTLTHRYRLEERWIERPSATGAASDYAFGLRFRYQARATIPLIPATRRRAPYLSAGDEIFLVGGPHAPNNLVDQNRAYAGLGVRWSPSVRGEVGYLNQAILRSNGTQVENNHTVQVSLGFTRAAARR